MKTENINVNREKPHMYISFPWSKAFSRYLKYGNAFMNFSVICMVNKKSLLSLSRSTWRNFNTDLMKTTLFDILNVVKIIIVFLEYFHALMLFYVKLRICSEAKRTSCSFICYFHNSSRMA